jgi:hypothetical protein
VRSLTYRLSAIPNESTTRIPTARKFWRIRFSDLVENLREMIEPLHEIFAASTSWQLLYSLQFLLDISDASVRKCRCRPVVTTSNHASRVEKMEVELSVNEAPTETLCDSQFLSALRQGATMNQRLFDHELRSSATEFKGEFSMIKVREPHNVLSFDPPQNAQRFLIARSR